MTLLELKRPALKMAIINEQQRAWNATLRLDFICPICEKIKSDGSLHEAFLRRGRNVSTAITFSKWNCAVLCFTCHMDNGQTEAAKCKLLAFKLSLGIDVWQIVNNLIASKDLVIHPGLPPKDAVIQKYKEKYNLE